MGVPLRMLAVCSQAAPHRAPGTGRVHALPDPEFRSFIRAFGGITQQVVDHNELWEIIEPALRADWAVAETYTTGPLPRIDCDVAAFRGSDDECVSYPDLAAWAEVTTGRASVQRLDGGHFLLASAATELMTALADRLCTGSAAAPGAQACRGA
jgi:surfactin synthase thioesterase subunit